MVHILAIIQILLIYLLVGVSFYGWGRVLFYPFKGCTLMPKSPVMAIWLGWAFTLLIFQILHFISPITVFVSAPVFVLGLLFFVFQIKKDIPRIPSQRSTLILLCFIILLFLGLAVLVASKAMLPPSHYDSGLYHLNAIRWINSYPIIPGLGNLHGRLAFNSSFFTYVAALNFYPLFEYGRSIANSFLLLLVLATIFQSIFYVVKQPHLLSTEHVFKFTSDLLIFPVVIYLALSSKGIASPTPDLASTLLQLAMFMLLAHGIAEWINGQRSQDYRAITLVILAASAVTIKLSNLAFLVVISCFAFLYIWQTSRSRFIGIFRIFSLPGLLVVVWGLQGFILSGAPLYPSTIGYIHFDWAVPIESIIEEANWVYSWARIPGTHWKNVLGSWAWLQPWFIDHSRLKELPHMFYPLIWASLFGIFAIFFGFIKKDKRPKCLECAILFPLIASMVFWFFTAPDPRFANATFYLAPIATSLVFLISIKKVVDGKMFIGVVLIVFLVINISYTYEVFTKRNYKYYSTSGFYSVKNVPLIRNTTSSGLSVYTPQTGDQCWDSAIPCTPYFKTFLRLRNPKVLSSGFSVKMKEE